MARNPTYEELLQKVRELEKKTLERERIEKVSAARMVIAHRCKEELGISAAEIARDL